MLTPTAARKAFSDSGLTINPDPKKVLNRLAQHHQAQPSSTLQQGLPHEHGLPQTCATVSSLIDAHRRKPCQQDASKIKHSLMEAFKKPHATISVLEAENTLLQKQDKQNQTTTKKVRTKQQDGNQMMLSKDHMITRQHAEHKLVQKRPAIEAKQRKKKQKEKRRQEKRTTPPPSQAPDNNNKAACDDDEAVSASSAAAATPLPPQAFDKLIGREPLGAIDNNNQDPFGFYATLPIATSSWVTL